MKYIATISGGKDSVTMCDLLLKNDYPVDYIVCTDTLLEFPLMYEYFEKIKTYFKDRYNKEIIFTKPKATFESWCFGTIEDKKSDLFGYVRGIPMVWSEPCYWRRESKVRPLEKLFKQDNITLYIGYTLGENRNIENTDKLTHSYPLRDIFKMSERDCQAYLINQEMENILYRFFGRTGCGICPAQSLKAFFEIWKNFKETWNYMKWIEKRLVAYEKMGMKVKNAYWFTEYRTCEDMEKLFIKADKQGSLFDFSDEPLKDCFCKI